MVLFLDSGIGGLPYCEHFMTRNPSRSVLYFADRGQFPYGAKSKESLAALLLGRIALLAERYPLEAAVLACNTASVSALEPLRARFPRLPFVGTVPAIKPAVQASRTGVVGVLGTERTMEDPYIDSLAARYGSGCRVVKVAAPELVEFVERRLFLSGGEEAAAEGRSRAASYMARFRAAGADGIVLGCTHFLFLRSAFRAAAAPDTRVYDSVEGVVRRAESLPERLPVSGRPVPAGGRILLAGGREMPGGFWPSLAERYGLELRCLEEAA